MKPLHTLIDREYELPSEAIHGDPRGSTYEVLYEAKNIQSPDLS
jgi:hypothetical protein